MANTAQTTTVKRRRSCVACRNQAGKTELFRIVRSPSGQIAFDATGRASGRGAYVCGWQCFEAALKGGRLERALKTKIDRDELEQIKADLALALQDSQGIVEE